MCARCRAAAKKAKNTVADPQRTKAIVEALRREMGAAPAAEPAAPAAPARELLSLDDYEASRTAPNHAHRATPSSNAWAAKPARTEQEKPSITSPDAFPAMPGAKVPDSLAQRQSSLQTQRTWKASLAGPPEPTEPPNPTANFTTFQIRQPPPPPPQPRGEASMSREDSIASSLLTAPRHEGSVASLPRAPPGINPAHTASVRVSQPSQPSPHSSIDDSQSVSSLTSSFQTSSYAAGAPLDVHISQGSCALPVGALYDDSSSAAAEIKLTKAQKKNLKRAERKARQTADGSESSGGQAGDAALLYQQCMVSIAHFKGMVFLQRLLNMNFDVWTCLAAIRRKGIGGDDAALWILDRQSESFNGGAQAWFEDAETYDGPSIEVDVSLEMGWLERVCAALPARTMNGADVYATVVDAQGDVQQALLQVIDQVRQMEMQWNEGHVGTESALAVLSDV